MTQAPKAGEHIRAYDNNEIARPAMMISHNLIAALEYDEQARATANVVTNSPGPSRRTSISQDSPTGAVGLPPPPRPKSRSGSVRRVKSPPMSPTSPFMGLLDTPMSSKIYPQTSTAVAANASSSNPYINPPPRLPHLEVADGVWRTHSRTPSLPSSPPLSDDANRRDSPRDDKHSSPVQVSSPESAVESVSSTEARPNFQRHNRYLSSLQKVEKILGKGKTLAVGKQSDVRDRNRRASADVSVAKGEDQDKFDKDVQPMMKQYRKLWERGKSNSVDVARSAPSSPIVESALTAKKMAESDPDYKRRELMVSHFGRSSAASLSLSAASSESSHEPPSTPNDPRISISSTIYQASNYSLQYSPHFHAPLNTTGRPNMNSDRDSFIDLTSPTFSPLSPQFSMNASFAASGEHTSSFYRTDSRSPDVSPRAAKPTLPHISTNSTKPPIPTSPKPTFNKRSKSAQPPAHRSAAPGDSPVAQEATVPSTLPPTTNFLKPQERSDRVRQTRKLAQMFGQSPGAIEAVAFSQLSFEANPPGGFLSASNNLVSNLTGKKKHQKAAVSMSVVPELENPAQPHSPEGIKNSLWSSRRHSSPLSPQQFSFIDASSSHDSHSSGVDQSSFVIEIGSQQGTAFSDWGSQIDREFRSGPTSPTSFMDLSEEDIANDTASSIITIQTPKADRRPGLLSSASSVYSFTSEDLAEEDRRRKREKLAKLHRFLGSRVPADLVLGQLDVTVATDLPPVAPVSAIERSDKMDPETRKVWVRRRRSSSAAELRGKWSDDIDRLKEELNDKEKAQNVRRAVKMEKLFGVQPPQTLYHTRFAPSHAEAAIGTPSHLRQQTLPPSPSSPSYSRNVNQAAYTRNKVKKANHRPGTAESTEPLINANTSHGKLPAIGHGFSDIYEHYRHSLNSLNDIIDRDDRASLERLHGIIHGESSEPILQPFTRQEEPPYEEPPTPKAERRRSLPTRTSMASISSAYSVAAPSEEEINFRARRKRAAKLTQFFGVDYRDLMGEVIDSLEKGLEEEGGRGTLRPDEVQELLHKLRKLKSKRNSLFN